jgi:hypothetical protein
MKKDSGIDDRSDGSVNQNSGQGIACIFLPLVNWEEVNEYISEISIAPPDEVIRFEIVKS